MKTKFALVAEPFSGEKLLYDILNRHPGIKMYGNLFDRTDYEYMSFLAKSGLLIKVGEDPIEFLESKILVDEDDVFQALGFGLLYNQAKSESWNKVWRYVRKGFKVIHFKQRNLLNRYLRSREKVAYLDSIEIQRAIDLSLSQRRENDTIFRHTETLDVYLEDLLADSQTVVSEVYDFLELTNYHQDIELEFTVSDQSKILNFEDLKSHFAGKPAGEYFQ